MWVTTSLSKPYRKRQSEPTGDTEARRKRVAKAQAAKRQAESIQEAESRRNKEAEPQAAKHQAESIQEADARRKRVAKAQAGKLAWFSDTPRLPPHLQATTNQSRGNLGTRLLLYHIPTYMILASYFSLGTRPSYHPNYVLEWRTYGRSLQHVEQVDLTSHTFFNNNSTCTRTYCNQIFMDFKRLTQN